VVLTISGCNPRYSVFKDHYENDVEQTNNVILIHDATVLSAIARNNYLIHQQRSIDALNWVNSTIADIVERKGYRVSDRGIWSVGLTFEPGTSILVFQGTSDEVPDSKNTVDVKRDYIPTYVKAIGFDDKAASVITDLHWPLSWLHDEKDWEDIVYSNVKSLDIPADSVLLVSQSIGVQVPWGAKVVQFFYSMINHLGSTEYLAARNLFFPQKEPWDSDTSVHLIAVLNHQGKLLWADVYEEIGGNRSEETLRNGLEKLFSHLPDHPNSLN
jgi:hypothetical protein